MGLALWDSAAGATLWEPEGPHQALGTPVCMILDSALLQVLEALPPQAHPPQDSQRKEAIRMPVLQGRNEVLGSVDAHTTQGFGGIWKPCGTLGPRV